MPLENGERGDWMSKTGKKCLWWAIAGGLLALSLVAALLLPPLLAPPPPDPTEGLSRLSKKEPPKIEETSDGVSSDLPSGERPPVILKPIDGSAGEDKLLHTLTFSFVGDCMLASYMGQTHSDSLNYAMAHRDPDYFFRFVSDYFLADDWTVGNCENVFTDRSLSPVEKNYRPAYWYRSPAANAGIFRVAGIDAVSVCNNHAGDYGDMGYEDTLHALREAGVSAGQFEEPLRFEKYGFRVTVLCGNLYSGYQADYILPQIERERPLCDYLIVYFHGGTERIHQPDDWKIAACRRLVDAGADLVLGMHPHVLQPCEEYKGKLICYSLGNFLFGGGRNEENRTAILQMQLTVKDGILTESRYEWVPCYLYATRDQSTPDCWLPKPIESESEKQRVLDFLAGKTEAPL